MSMRRSAATLLSLLAGAVALPAQPAAPAASPVVAAPSSLYGKLENDHYIAPGGVYRIPVPVFPQLGGQISDTENVVTFDDPLGLHLSIASFPLDLSQKWEWETRGAREYLAYFHATFVLSDFQRRHPGAQDEASIFVSDLYAGTLLVFSLLPGGSFFTEQSSVLGAAAAPVPAKRGTLLFVREGRVFLLSLELAERITQRSTFNKTPEEENAILRDRLIGYARRLEFPVRKPAAAAP